MKNTVCQFSSFDQLPPEGRTLFEQEGAKCLFTSLPWFQVFAKNALSDRDRIRIYCSVSAANGATCFESILPLVQTQSLPAFLKPRELRSAANYYSSLFCPLSRPNASRTLSEIIKAISLERPRWDTVNLKPLDVSSPLFIEFEDAFRSAGFTVQRYFCFGNWYLDVRGRTFRDYFEALPSTLKNTVIRKKKKLLKSFKSSLKIVSTEGEELDSAIEAYREVYSASWKRPEPYPMFVPELIRSCARQGTLRLGVLRVNDVPAAVQLWIVQNSVASIYKLAYDEKFNDLSVGTILTTAMFEHALDVDAVREVDYLTGDDAYKKDWMSNRRERWGILAMNPRTVYGVAAIVRHVGGRAVARAFRSFRSLELRRGTAGEAAPKP